MDQPLVARKQILTGYSSPKVPCAIFPHLGMKTRSLLLRLVATAFLAGLAPSLWAQDGLEGALSRMRVASPLNFTEPFRRTLAIGDFDNDQKPDGAVLVDSSRIRDRNSFRIELHLSGNRNSNLSFESTESALTVTASDINRDGATDLIIEQSLSHKRLFVWLGDGQGGFHKSRVEDFPATQNPNGEQLGTPSAQPESPVMGLPSQRFSEISILAASSVRGRPPSFSGLASFSKASAATSRPNLLVFSRAPPHSLPL